MKTADDLRDMLTARLVGMQEAHEARAEVLVDLLEAKVAESGCVKLYFNTKEDPKVYEILRSHGFIVEETQDPDPYSGNFAPTISGSISFKP